MAIAHVQSGNTLPGNVTSANLAFGSNNAAGNLIVVSILLGAQGRTITVSDTNLNTYSLVRKQTHGAANESSLYYAENCAAGANTVTVAISGAAAAMRFAIHEYSGIATSGALDQQNSATGTSTIQDSGAITTTTAEQLVFVTSTADVGQTAGLVVAVGASANAAAASGDLSVTPPATQTDDIMICAVTSHDNVACTFPAGWNIYQEANNTAAMRATLAWKRCTGAEGAFTITHTGGDGIVANVEVFRAAEKDVSPIGDSVLTANASSSTCTAAAITPSKAYGMLFFTMHDSDNGGSSLQTSATFGAMTEVFDNASNLGLDEAVSGAVRSNSSTDSSGSSTGTLSVGPDVNSGGNTAVSPRFTIRQAMGNRMLTSDLVLSSTETLHGYGNLAASDTWGSIIASFKAPVVASAVKQLGLLGVG